MTYSKYDRALLDQDRVRVAQVDQHAYSSLPDTFTLKDEDNYIELTLRKESDTNSGALAILISVVMGVEERRSVPIKTFQQPFHDHEGRDWRLRPYKSYDPEGDFPLDARISLTHLNAEGQSSEKPPSSELGLSYFLSAEYLKNIKELDLVGDDLKTLLLNLYQEIEITLEESVKYVRTSVAIHKQAIQNAVDITQSKRLSFLEAGSEPYWQGIIMMVVVALFIEIVVVSATTAIVGTLISGLAARMPWLGRSIAKVATARTKLTPKQKWYADFVGTLKANVKALKKARLRGGPFPKAMTPSDRQRSLQSIRKEIAKIEGEVARFKTAKKQIDKFGSEKFLESKEGKEYIEAKAKEIAEYAKIAAKGAKEITGGFLSKKTSPKVTFDSSVLPVDVALKIHVQSIMDNELWQLEQLLVDIREVIKSLPFLNDDEAKKQISICFKTLTLVLEIASATDELKQEFNEQTLGDLNQRLSADYEFRLWALLYGGKSAIYRALGLSQTLVTYDYGKPRWVELPIYKPPISEADYNEKKDSREYTDTYNEYWIDISKAQYDQWKTENMVVKVVADTSDSGRRNFFRYMSARFFDGARNNEIAESLTEAHDEMHKVIKKAEETFQDQSSEQRSGIVWVETEPRTQNDTTE